MLQKVEQGKDGGALLLKAYKASVGSDESILEIDGGDHCPILTATA